MVGIKELSLLSNNLTLFVSLKRRQEIKQCKVGFVQLFQSHKVKYGDD